MSNVEIVEINGTLLEVNNDLTDHKDDPLIVEFNKEQDQNVIIITTGSTNN